MLLLKLHLLRKYRVASVGLLRRRGRIPSFGRDCAQGSGRLHRPTPRPLPLLCGFSRAVRLVPIQPARGRNSRSRGPVSALLVVIACGGSPVVQPRARTTLGVEAGGRSRL